MGRSGAPGHAEVSIGVIRAFVALAEAGGFHSGGAELEMSGPALALRVKALEEVLGARLISSAPNLRLTETGRRCLALAKIVLCACDGMAANVDDLDAMEARL